MVRPSSYSMFYSTGCDPRVSSCVHTQPFGRWASDWRWFLPRRSSVLPRLSPCDLIATLLQWWGYRLLIAVKPLRASCVLSPAASWQHSNKLLAMQLPCTQRGLLPFGPGPVSLHATVVSLIWTSAKSSRQIIHWISGQSLALLIYSSLSFMLCVCVCVCECVWDASYTSLTLWPRKESFSPADGSIYIYRFIICFHCATSKSHTLACSCGQLVE